MKNGFLKIGVAIVFIIGIIHMTKKKISGASRDNNPFHVILTDDVWLGQVPGEGRFVYYDTPEHGIRAGLINLYNGYFSRQLTLRQILSRYAPEKDGNDEAAYLSFVVKKTGLIPEQIPLKYEWLSVASAILRFEEGYEVMGPVELENIVNQYKLVNYA